MKVAKTWPPNIKQIREALGPDKPNVVYSYGDTIYAPNGGEISDDLMVHEQVHEKQHGKDPKAWWDKYLTDAKFRLDMEVEAYRAQYQFMRQHYNRKIRRTRLVSIAKDLSGPMYGNMIDYQTARNLIEATNDSH